MLYRMLVFIVALVVLTGCERRAKPVFTVPTATVAWRDLIDGDVKPPDNDYSLLVSGPTTGEFPVSLAVARIGAVAPDEPDPPGPGEYTLAMDMVPTHDFLRWNSVFHDIRPISEVFPLSRVSLNGQNVNVDAILDATVAMTGRTCLVYATADLTATESEIRGVLYSAESGKALAIIHARGVYVEPNEDERDDATRRSSESGLEKLLTPCTPRLVAEDRFRNLVRDCVLALLKNDRPAIPESENGWVPEGPLAPPIWPPVYFNWPRAPYPYGSPYPQN